jgi:hypothetical protein
MLGKMKIIKYLSNSGAHVLSRECLEQVYFQKYCDTDTQIPLENPDVHDTGDADVVCFSGRTMNKFCIYTSERHVS